MLPEVSRQIYGSVVICIGVMAIILQVLWIFSIGKSSLFFCFYSGAWGGFVLIIAGSFAKSRLPLKGTDSMVLIGAVISFLMFCEALVNTVSSFCFRKDIITKDLAIVCILLSAVGFVCSLRLRSLLIKINTRSVISTGKDVPDMEEIKFRICPVSPKTAEIPSTEERPPSYQAPYSRIDTNEFGNILEKCIIDK